MNDTQRAGSGSRLRAGAAGAAATASHRRRGPVQDPPCATGLDTTAAHIDVLPHLQAADTLARSAGQTPTCAMHRVHGGLTWEQPTRIARGLNVAEQGLYRERLGGVCRLPGVSNPFRCGSRRLACSIVRLCVCRSLAPIPMTWGRPLLYNGCGPKKGRSLDARHGKTCPGRELPQRFRRPLEDTATILPQHSCAFALGRGISRPGAFALGSTAPSRG